MIIALIGPTGAGKTTTGKALAKRLSFEFYDLDTLIEERLKQSIAEIFEQHGESTFREQEFNSLNLLLNNCRKPAIIATGAGIVLDERCRRLLKQQTQPIYIYASINTQISRLKNTKNRPLLSTTNLKQTLNDMQNGRENYYCELQTQKINTDNKTIVAICEEIIQIFSLN